jgi:small GTP-binding protein
MFDPDTVSTVGAAFVSKVVTIGETSIKLQIWDTGGSERYRAMAPIYYQDADGAIIVYDITCRQSFQEVTAWFNELRDHARGSIAVALAGNKSDLTDDRIVEVGTGQNFARDQKIPIFMETSALTGENIPELFSNLALHIATHQAKAMRTDLSPALVPRPEHKTKNQCC